MNSLFMTGTPPLIILEPPPYRPTGRRHYRCMVCTELFRISDTSYQTIRDLRHEKKLYVVVCYDCHRDVLPKLSSAQNIAVDQKAARKLLGYR